jgi:hypothetical protein
MSVFPRLTKNLIQLIGPSVLFVALSMSGGELLIWPDLIGKYGLGIAILLPLVLVLQASVNLEIERYTLATGRPTLSSLMHSFPFLRPIFITIIFISLVWPGWITTASSMMALLLGLSQYSSIFGIILLILLIFIWQNSKSYQILEKLAKYGLLIVLSVAFISLPVLILVLGQIPNLNFNFNIQSKDRFLFLSALAYGGVSGVLNFVQSSWIINKKYGAAELSPEEQNQIDWQTKESKNNWHKWWKLIVSEHLSLFVGGNIIGIVFLGLIASLTVSGKNLSGFAILSEQIKVFSSVQPLLGLLWGVGIIIVFIMAQMTILDAAGHLIHQSLPTKGHLSKVSSSRLSQIIAFCGIIILLFSQFISSFSQPSVLLQISAVLSAIFMIFYPPLLLWFNCKHLDSTAKPKWNIIPVLACSLFYAIFVLLTFL